MYVAPLLFYSPWRGLGNHGDWIIGFNCVMNPLKAETPAQKYLNMIMCKYMKLNSRWNSVISVLKLFAKLKKKCLFSCHFLCSFSLFQWVHYSLPNYDSSLCVCVCMCPSTCLAEFNLQSGFVLEWNKLEGDSNY